jgi:hypothetical protein
MVNQQSSSESPLGCGLAGCAGGLLLGFLGGGLLLILGALVLASQTVPVVPASFSPDLRLALQEDFLNRFLASSTPEIKRLDTLPGNQVSVQFDTTVPGFGAELPVQVTLLLSLQAVDGALQASLLDVQVAGIELTSENRDLLSSNIPGFNQEMDQFLENVSTAMGAPVVLTGLTSSESELQLEASESP